MVSALKTKACGYEESTKVNVSDLAVARHTSRAARRDFTSDRQHGEFL